MGGKTMIGGALIDIKPGKALINGTGYNIKLGKTCIGGANYNINFSKVPVGTLFEFTKIGDTEWVCPESGNYNIKLHGAGGRCSYQSVARDHYESSENSGVYSVTGYTTVTFGGGSGQQDTKYLYEGHTYRIHIPGDENDVDYTSDGLPLRNLGKSTGVIWPNAGAEYKGVLISSYLPQGHYMLNYNQYHSVAVYGLGHHNCSNAYKAGTASITDMSSLSTIMSCDGATNSTHSGNISSDGGTAEFSFEENHFLWSDGRTIYYYNYIYNCIPRDQDPVIGWGGY